MSTVNYTYLPQYEPGTYHPAFDPTGSLAANKVTGEIHTVTAANNRDFHFIVPLFAPFFKADLTVTHQSSAGVTRTLVEGVDYLLAFEFIGASRGCSRPVYGGISLLNTSLIGRIGLTQYRTLGGNWCLNLQQITQILANASINPRVTAWEQVTDYPNLFPVIDHEWNLTDMVGMKGVVNALGEVADAIAARPAPIIPVDFTKHLNDYANPHQTTKSQVGLGNVNNYATATVTQTQEGTANNLHTTPQGVKALIDQAQLDLSLGLDAHIGDTSNPHQTTKAQVGLSNVNNYPIATYAEATGHVSNDRYMTPLRTWEEIGVALNSGFGATFTEAVINSNITVHGNLFADKRIYLSAGPGLTNGLVFNEIGSDTGIGSPGDNYIDIYSAGALQMRFQAADQCITNFSQMLGSNSSLTMSSDSNGRGSFVCRAVGAGDGNLAGLSLWNSSYAIKIGIRNDGYLGFGGWSRAAWSMYSDPAGNFVASGNVIAYSDPRLKERVTPIADACALLRQLRGVYFYWKEGIAHTEGKAGKQDLGVMADEVKKIFPQIVYKSISLEGVDYDMVAYEKLVPVLIEGHNAHDMRISALEKALSETNARLAERDKLIEAMSAQLSAFQSIVDRMNPVG